MSDSLTIWICECEEMASLWQFFGLPNPENPSVDKKGKKTNSAPPSVQKQPSLSQEEAPKAIELEETTPLTPAKEEPSASHSGLLAKSMMKPAPPLWKGPLTAENEPFHDLGSHTKNEITLSTKSPAICFAR